MLPIIKSNLFPRVSRFFEDDWNDIFDWSNRSLSESYFTVPSVNILENPDNFVIEMAAPGMKKDDFQIEVQNNMLTIKCEKEDKEAVENDKYTKREFKYHSFHRSFNLNHNLIEDGKIEATYKEGILKLLIPKKEEAKEKPTRLIEIK